VGLKKAGILPLLAVISVLACYVYGFVAEKRHLKNGMTACFPDTGIPEVISRDPMLCAVKFPEGKYYVIVEKAKGWGGPAVVATKIDSAGIINEVKVISHMETPAFFQALLREEFFNQFSGMDAAGDFSCDEDIDCVSGATISSVGFTNAIRESGHYFARAQLGMVFETPQRKYSGNGFIIPVFFAVAWFLSQLKKKWMRNVVLILSVTVLGFMLNYSLSVSHFSALLMGFIPDLYSNSAWYFLMGSILLMILLYGKNLYCTWICPFGALQELFSKVSNINIPVPAIINKHKHMVSGFIAWVSLCVALIFRNPALGNYEPFAAIFSFSGYGIIWIILPVIIFGSFFIKRLWCRFFCPVGYLLNAGCKIRSNLVHEIRKES